MAKKNFETNTGSKSNNFVTDTRTEDLVLAESTFLAPEETREITEDLLVGGISIYNDAGMTVRKELFNRRTVQRITDKLVDKGFLSNKYSYEVLYKNDMLDSEYIFKTFEEALEIGLYESLKLI